MPPSATLVVGQNRHPLSGADPAIVPAGMAILELDGVLAPEAVRLDGRRPGVGWDASTRRATVAADLTRDTGFHELLVGPSRFLFGTEDAKLRNEGVVSLLDYLGARGLAWSGAMYFSDSRQALRDLRLDRTWLARAGEAIVSVGTAVANRPWSMPRGSRSRLDRGVPDVAATMRLLREPPGLLEEHDRGPIRHERADGSTATYAPREVVSRSRERSSDTIGNRRVTALLEDASALARAIEARAPRSIGLEVAEFADRLERLLRRPPFAELRRRPLRRSLPAAQAGEERFDRRYATAWALYRELHAERHWDPRREIMPEWAYGGHADAIYQRFCGQLLADHLGLRPTAEPPGKGAGPHFAGKRFDLYLDVTPPRSVIRDWRDDSERRAGLRPDLVLHERATGRVALLDAKYRNDGERASADSLTDMQLYLQAYSHRSVGVLFPPRTDAAGDAWRVHEVSDGTFTIYEMPCLPEPRMADFLAERIDPALERLLADDGVR